MFIGDIEDIYNRFTIFKYFLLKKAALLLLAFSARTSAYWLCNLSSSLFTSQKKNWGRGGDLDFSKPVSTIIKQKVWLQWVILNTRFLHRMLLTNSDIVPRSSFSDLPITWGNPQQSIKFNIFSLYGHIGPALTPEPSDQEALNFKIKNGIFKGVTTNLSYMFPLLWK